MSTSARTLFAGFTFVAFLGGCAHFKQMTEADALGIADRTAEKAGYRLVDFKPARIVAHEGHTWSVKYDGKTSAADRNGMVELHLGNYFYIFVDDRTGASQVKTGD
jgi:hypothetical protein